MHDDIKIYGEIRKIMKLQTSNAYKHGRSNDPVWQFLAEYPLSEFTSAGIDDLLMTGLLLQRIRDLGIPPECLKEIERSLIEFIRQQMMQLNQGKREFPIVIHLYCQKKIIETRKLAKIDHDPQAKQRIVPLRVIHPADTNAFGGWGFFIIERARDCLTDSTVAFPNFIDLYLYKEGE